MPNWFDPDPFEIQIIGVLDLNEAIYALIVWTGEVGLPCMMAFTWKFSPLRVQFNPCSSEIVRVRERAHYDSFDDDDDDDDV